MSKQFKFPDPGEGLEEAEVLELNVGEGDAVNDGDVLLTVETDKAATEVAAPFSGSIERIEVSTGQTVHVGDVLLTYREDGDAETESEAEGDDEAAPSRPSSQESERRGAPQRRPHQERQREDEAAEEGKTTERQAPAADAGRGRQRTPVPAAPSTRRLARERGVDLAQIEPSGPHGRVASEDVEAAARAGGVSGQAPQGRGSELTPGVTPAPLPDPGRWGETERQPLRSVRRSTAVNMARAWAEIPHVFHQDVADITELERFRGEYAETAQAEGGRFSLTVVVMKALVYALKRFPRFNASLDAANEEIVLKRYFHIGLAVATERGLLVPVMRDVDRKDLTELTAEVSALAQRTRDGEATRDEMQGGSITLTNPGGMGGTALTPLINPPQVAIVGMAQARWEPAVVADHEARRVEPRLRLPLTLGFDHRVNDGADAARFVTTLIETLQDPRALLLRI